MRSSRLYARTVFSLSPDARNIRIQSSIRRIYTSVTTGIRQLHKNLMDHKEADALAHPIYQISVLLFRIADVD